MIGAGRVVSAATRRTAGAPGAEPRAALWPTNGEAKLFKEMGDARCSQLG
jgi:hypothetical protein